MDVSLILEIGIALGGLIGITIGFIYFNTYRFVSILRQVTRKNFGIVYFTTKGQAMFPVIKDFSKDTIRTNKGIWFFRAGSIYRQVDKEKGQSINLEDDEVPINYEKKSGMGLFSQNRVTGAKLHHVIAPEEINFRQGVPIVFLGIDDMIPKKIADERMINEPNSRNPYQVEATLGKEVTAARLEALNKAEKDLKMLILVIAILVVVSIGVSYLTYDRVNLVGAMMNNLTARIP
jgi:hypothetical protein